MPARLTRDQRVSTIVAAALAIANEQSLIEINFRDLASAAGVSVPTIRYHFKRKNNLLAAVARHQQASDSVKEEARTIGII